MSEKPTMVDPDWAVVRIARALGCAGYSVEECDAIMAWLEHTGLLIHGICLACRGRGFTT